MPRRIDEVAQAVIVKLPLVAAFTAFAERLGTWWPSQFTFGEEGFEAAVIEPRVGGRWFERDVGGEELDWGEVRVWEPPDRVVLSWRVSSERTQEPPERASQVEVRFAPVGPAETRVELVHRGFENHGEGGPVMRAGMASEQGWPGLLDRYRQVAEGGLAGLRGSAAP